MKQADRIDIDILINGIGYKGHKDRLSQSSIHDFWIIQRAGLEIENIMIQSAAFWVHAACYNNIMVYLSIDVSSSWAEHIDLVVNGEKANLKNIVDGLQVLESRSGNISADIGNNISVGVYSWNSVWVRYNIMGDIDDELTWEFGGKQSGNYNKR